MITIDVEENRSEEDEEEVSTPKWLRLLLTAGFALVAVGLLVIFVAASLGESGSASGGVVVFIGPFPIVFGAGPDAALLILVGIVLTVISIVLFFILRRKSGWV